MLRKLLIGGAAAATLVLAGSGVALAVSDGGYDYERQHCSAHADNSHNKSYVEDGCHPATVVLYDGGGHEYVNVGTQQQADGAELPTQGGDVNVDPGHGIDPVAQELGGRESTTYQNPEETDGSGMNLYFGSDDNLDFGEHDNSPQGSGGPSDGGAWQINISPEYAAWLAALSSGDPGTMLTYISHNPEPFVNAQIGMGADGHDASATTNQRTVYSGDCGDAGNPKCPPRDAGDYEGMDWDPTTCSGEDDTPSDCGGQSLGAWDAHRGTTYAEPGVQVYEDPDPQGSPEPADTSPQPAAAVTTCGVYVGGGPANFSGASSTGKVNDAGQLEYENDACSDTNG